MPIRLQKGKRKEEDQKVYNELYMYEDKGDGKEIADYIKIVALDIVPEIFTAITIKTRD